MEFLISEISCTDITLEQEISYFPINFVASSLPIISLTDPWAQMVTEGNGTCSMGCPVVQTVVRTGLLFQFWYAPLERNMAKETANPTTITQRSLKIKKVKKVLYMGLFRKVKLLTSQILGGPSEIYKGYHALLYQKHSHQKFWQKRIRWLCN